MYKFRSMDLNAEDRLKDLLKYNETNEGMFKMADDPRVTKVGKFIRKYSIDELPQLINVIKGEMSLIGPRPCLSRELKTYKTGTTSDLPLSRVLQDSGRSADVLQSKILIKQSAWITNISTTGTSDLIYQSSLEQYQLYCSRAKQQHKKITKTN